MNNQKGFTLIEVLISITLLAFIMLIIMNISSNAMSTKDRVTKEDNKMLQIETALNRIQWDIEHSYSPLYFSIPMKANTQNEGDLEAYNNFMQKYQNNNRFKMVSYEGLPIPKNELEGKDEFTFFTAGNRRKFQDQKQSSFAWIKYQLSNVENEDDLDEEMRSFESTKYLTRQFMADDVFNPDSIKWDDVKKQTLLRNVTKLKIQFWDFKTKKWQENLRVIADGDSKLNGVKLIIEIQEDEDNTYIIEKIVRPLFPKFTSEDYYELVNVKDEDFLNSNQNEFDDSGI